MPPAPVREPGEKRAVEELVGSEEGAARAMRGPAVGFTAAAALGVSRPGPGGHRVSPRSLPSASWSLRTASSLQSLKTSRAIEESPLPSRHFPVPTAPHSAELRETLPMAPGPPRFFPHRHPHSVADTASWPQPTSPQAIPVALDTGNSWVPDSGSPRPPSSVNSACFSTKWRRRSRAHVAAFPLPVLISSFAARPRGAGSSTGQ